MNLKKVNFLFSEQSFRFKQISKEADNVSQVELDPHFIKQFQEIIFEDYVEEINKQFILLFCMKLYLQNFCFKE